MSAATSQSRDDTVLMQDIARRDKGALEQLYQRHGSVLFALALKILNDRADAEEVLQDTFVQVWKAAESYDDRRGNPLGWLIMLTRSRAIDRLHSRATKPSRLKPRQDSPRPAQPASASETQGIVTRAIEALPAEQRRPVELAYFGGFTQSEVAQRLGEPLGTVKTRMRAAVLRLREELGAVGREGGAR